jgi:hypothetical protein
MFYKCKEEIDPDQQPGGHVGDTHRCPSGSKAGTDSDTEAEQKVIPIQKQKQKQRARQ